LLFLAVGAKLLEIGPQVARFFLVLDAGEDHLGVRNLGTGIVDIVFEGRFAPRDAGVLIGVGIIIVGDAARTAAFEAVQLRADLVFGVFADGMTGETLLK